MSEFSCIYRPLCFHIKLGEDTTVVIDIPIDFNGTGLMMLLSWVDEWLEAVIVKHAEWQSIAGVQSGILPDIICHKNVHIAFKFTKESQTETGTCMQLGSCIMTSIISNDLSFYPVEHSFKQHNVA